MLEPPFLSIINYRCCVNYQELYTVRRNELVSAQGRRRTKLKEEWDRRRDEADRDFRHKQDELERRYAHAQ